MIKSITETDFEERKIEFISRLYLDPADQDYLAARWAYNSAVFNVFYWCAGQACEKYLKAFLLLQNESTEGYGHRLTSLFDKAKHFDTDSMIPSVFALPETTAMGRDAWHSKPMVLYIDYLEKYGHPDNRYAFYGTYVNGPVLHALDIVCCSLRRLMRAKNFTGEDLFAYRNERSAMHERIGNDQSWMIDPELLLERLYAERYSVGQDVALRASFSNMNFAFFTERGENERGFGGQHFHGSPLYNHLVGLAQICRSENNQIVIKQLRDWANGRIQMNNVIRKKLGIQKRKS